MDKPQKALQLINYLEEKIVSGQFPGGSKIPSVRTFMADFKVSYGTALAGIDYLCSKELLVKKNRSGIYVNTQKNQVQGEVEITVFSVMHSGGMYATAFSSIQQYADNNNVNLRQCELSPANATADILTQLSRTAAGVLMLSEYDDAIEQLPLDKPSVGILMHNTFKGQMSVVDIDPFFVAEAAVNYFNENNISNVVILTDPRQTYENRGMIFSHYWQQSGGTCHMLVDPQGEIEFSADCGYFFTSDNLLHDKLQIYENQFQKQLTDDYVVLGVDGKCLIYPQFKKFPTVAVDWRQIGRYAIEECLYRINYPGSKPKRIYVPGELVIP